MKPMNSQQYTASKYVSKLQSLKNKIKNQPTKPNQTKNENRKEFCTWGGITPGTSTGWGPHNWKAAWQKRT